MVGAPIRPSTTPFSTTPPNPPPFHVTYARGGDVDPPSVALAKALVPDFHFMPRPRAKAAYTPKSNPQILLAILKCLSISLLRNPSSAIPDRLLILLPGVM